jgi:hypothetical protein
MHYLTLIAIIDKLGDIVELPESAIQEALDQYIAQLEAKVRQIEEEEAAEMENDGLSPVMES